MKFSELASMQRSQELRGQRRHRLAKDHLQKAFEALSKGMAESGDLRKKLFLESCDSFNQALKNHRANPDIYIGLAYLHILLGARGPAFNYLDEVERISPGHPDRVLMLATLEHVSDHLDEAGSLQSGQDAISSDDLFDQLESQLAQYTGQVLILKRQLESQINPDEHQNIKAQLGLWRKQYEALKSPLLELQTEFDTHTMALQMNQIAGFISILSQKEKAMASMLGLLADILALIGQVQISQQEFLQSKGDPELSLETFLDQCDGFADQLDFWDEKGYFISGIETRYSQLVFVLECFQDLLDEA